MIKILIVEDDDISAEVFKRHIKKAHDKELLNPLPRIVVANTFEKAKISLEVFTPDIILLDLSLPDVVGLEAVEYFTKTDIPVVVLSAGEDKERVKKCFQLGIKDYKLKAFTDMTEVLSETILEVLEKDLNDKKLRELLWNTLRATNLNVSADVIS